MAITAVGKRLHESYSQRQDRITIQYTLTGTYATGGFVTPFLNVPGSLGTNQVSSKNPLTFTWYSPTGYIYVSTITFAAGVPAVVTKIFSAPGTELANTTAAPDGTIIAVIDALRY
jgi:hypothetical protein